MNVLRWTLLGVWVCSFGVCRGQRLLDQKLEGSRAGMTLSSLLIEAGRKHEGRFYFMPEWIDSLSIKRSYDGQSLSSVMDDIFRGRGLGYVSMYPNVVVIVRDPTNRSTGNGATRSNTGPYEGIPHFIFGSVDSERQALVEISGTITDAANGASLAGAGIKVHDTDLGTTTDAAGRYKLKVPPGDYVLEIDFLSYQGQEMSITAFSNGVVNLAMEEQPIVLNEVIVRDQSSREVSTRRVGEIRLNLNDLGTSPALLGEGDVIKQLQSLPGVTTVGEAASGFNVRGGSVDQNLILYDGIPVYNSSHVFGFFSAFNPDAIREVSFFRGGIPALYGGRGSSVLDIRSADGDFSDWRGTAGLGMITGNVMVSGPLVMNKTSLAASMRSTYSNWLAHTIHTDYADLRNSSVSFYDGSLKVTHQFGDDTDLSFTTYASHDAFRLTGDSTYRWSNMLASAILEHGISSRVHSQFVVGVSSYDYSVLNDDYETASVLSYRITSPVVKAGFNYRDGNEDLNFGWQATHYIFSPGTLRPNSPVSNADRLALDKQHATESAFYISDERSFYERLFLEAGLRLPLFVSFGPASINLYNSDTDRDITQITGNLHFRSGEPIKAYWGAEPRLSIRWMAGPLASFKVGYNHMIQYLQLVTNTTAVTPLDIWQPSGYYFKPQQTDQVSVGFFQDSNNRNYGGSVEMFYKHIRNILDFKNGAQLVLNDHLETDLLQGVSKAYGLETSFYMNTSPVSLSFNYTYSRAFHLFGGPSGAESINNGIKYPASWDQPHVFNFLWKWEMSRRYFLTGNFTFHSGRPVTVPISLFTLEHTTVAYFSDRNQYRIPDYHRLDLALIIKGNHKLKKWARGTWIISAYNVYARRNPYTVFFKSTDSGIPKPYQLSIVGTVLPSVSYNLTF